MIWMLKSWILFNVLSVDPSFTTIISIGRNVCSSTELIASFKKISLLWVAITHEIFIRYRDDITLNNSSKIIFGERQFNIRSILNIEEKNRFFKIEAQENVAIWP